MKKRKQTQTRDQKDVQSFAGNNQNKKEIEALYVLSESRIGGAVNIRGIGYQLLYSMYVVLDKFTNEPESTIRLEGIEDIDLHLKPNPKYIQIKTSIGSFDANRIWSMNVLQNFYAAYELDKTAQFCLVHNSIIATGMLDVLSNSHYTLAQLQFWQSKFKAAGRLLSIEELRSFFNNVTVDKADENQVFEKITSLLFEKYSINHGAELPYIRTLFYNLFEWAKARKSIQSNDIKTLIQFTTDSFSHFPTNEAIRNDWITPISYTIPEDVANDFSYYDGKAARPIDIALGLNVRRPVWEHEIEQCMKKAGVTIIKSSSGQGKSTIAYQIAKNYSDAGLTVYRINYCPTHHESKHISDFLETRLRIGETPILIVDGLNHLVAEWGDVAEKLKEKPHKFLVTTREEDWMRFGADQTKLTINEVRISLSEHEAKEIYSNLKHNKKIKAGIDAWQPIWEQLKDRGLLIEFIFLLTQGQMIRDRLQSQISTINKDIDAAVKLEILRIVSTADTLNIRVRTEAVTKYIQRNYKLNTDRNELYKQLEKEYYINFSQHYIQGLHPVRSRHLVEILNSNIGMEQTLLSVLQVIDEEYAYDYFMNVLVEYPQIDIDKFCDDSAVVVGTWNLKTIVCAIDGIMHSEPYKYWRNNKLTIDEAFDRGGFMLFLADLLPFNQLNTIEKLASSLEGSAKENLLKLLELARKLPKFSIEQSTVYRFVKCLEVSLKGREKVKKYDGIAFLFKWFQRLSIRFPNILEVNETELLHILADKDIKYSAEIYNYHYLANPEEYMRFLNANYDTIIGLIKVKSNTLTIYQEGNDIHMRYLLDNDLDKANELSIYRIDIIQSFLPNFDRYCTEAIVLPFPNEAIAKFTVQASTKHIPAENLFDDFDAHINQIWMKTIENQYCSDSIFEWQKQYLDFRQTLVETLRSTIKLFEAHLEKKSSRLRSISNQVAEHGTLWLQKELRLKKLPALSNKYFEKHRFESEQLGIGRFCSSMRNFLNQLPDLFKSEFRLPLFNLREALQLLPKFQENIRHITAATHSYFQLEEIEEHEKINLSRLVWTVERYQEYIKTDAQRRIVNARKEVDEWWTKQNELRIENLHITLDLMANQTGFRFHVPSSIIVEGSLKTAVIGVEGVDLLADDFLKMSIAGTLLLDLDITFFTFLFIRNKKTNYGIRLSTEYFEKIVKMLDGGEYSMDLTGNPIPIIPDEKMLSYIKDISIEKVEIKKSDESFYNIMMHIWKLSEYRQRLAKSNTIEVRWLKTISDEYNKIIGEQLPHLDLDDPLNQKARNLVEAFLTGDTVLSTNEIVELMNQRALKSLETETNPIERIELQVAKF